jgi:soluble lytic murein transglycosylase-like protein
MISAARFIRPVHTSAACMVVWLGVVCAVSVLVQAQAQAQEADGTVAWISADQHQRVIMPKLSVPAARVPAASAAAYAPTSPAAPEATGDASGAAVEQLLERPVRQAKRTTRSHRFTPEMQAMLARASRHFAVDAHLVKAVIHAESAFNPRAVSPKNAIGLMQVLPSTARDLGLQDLQGSRVEQLMTDPRVSIVLGTKYLAEQLARFNGNVELAVAAYNAGPGAVLKAGHRVPNYPETQQYVRRVLSLAQAYRKAAAANPQQEVPA